MIVSIHRVQVIAGRQRFCLSLRCELQSRPISPHQRQDISQPQTAATVSIGDETVRHLPSLARGYSSSEQ